MSLVVATGSNLGNRKAHLDQARTVLAHHFKLLAASRVYRSQAVDYLDQPEFLNQVLEFSLPIDLTPQQTMNALTKIEDQIGRHRQIPKGPRVIDLDILFWSDTEINRPRLQIPHPRLFARSFVVRPLRELPCFARLQQKYNFANSFTTEAWPVD